MIQNVIVGLIIAAAVVFAVWRLVRTVKGKGSCGCDGCPYAGDKECHCNNSQPKLPDIKL